MTRMPATIRRIRFQFGIAMALLGLSAPSAFTQPTLSENCTVTVLNRTSQVNREGFWVVRNVPTSLGYVRAHVTCFQNGITTVGESNYFLVPQNGLVSTNDFSFSRVGPAPATLTLSAASTNIVN